METNNAIQKLIKKMMNRYSMFSKPIQYEKVAEQLKISSRWVRLIEKGEKPSEHLAELIRIMAQG